MPGTIYRMIEEIVKAKSAGNAKLADLTRTRIMLKGIMIDRFGPDSADDPIIIARLQQIARDMKVEESIKEVK